MFRSFPQSFQAAFAGIDVQKELFPYDYYTYDKIYEQVDIESYVNGNNIVELSNSNITGSGRLNNNGANIVISSDQATSFTGDYYQYGDSSTAKLDVLSVIENRNEVSNVFSGTKYIQCGDVNIERTNGINYSDFILYDGVRFTNTSLSSR